MGSIDLTSCTPKVANSKSKKHCIELATPGRSYWVVADNPEEMHTWIRCIKEASQQCFQSMKAPTRSATASKITPPKFPTKDGERLSRSQTSLPSNYVPETYDNYEPSFENKLEYLDEESNTVEEETDIDLDAKQFVITFYTFLKIIILS